MTIEEVLQMIDKLVDHHEEYMCSESADYHEGAIDALEELRDAIKEGSEE